MKNLNSLVVASLLAGCPAAFADGELQRLVCWSFGSKSFEIKFAGPRYVDSMQFLGSESGLVEGLARPEELKPQPSATGLDLALTMGTCVAPPDGQKTLLTCDSSSAGTTFWGQGQLRIAHDRTVNGFEETAIIQRQVNLKSFKLTIEKEPVTSGGRTVNQAWVKIAADVELVQGAGKYKYSQLLGEIVPESSLNAALDQCAFLRGDAHE